MLQPNHKRPLNCRDTFTAKSGYSYLMDMFRANFCFDQTTAFKTALDGNDDSEKEKSGRLLKQCHFGSKFSTLATPAVDDLAVILFAGILGPVELGSVSGVVFEAGGTRA